MPAFEDGLSEIRDFRPVEEEADGARITHDEDGSSTVDFEGDRWEARTASGEFDENLAEAMEPTERLRLGERLSELVRVDLESRSDWEKRITQALEILGLKNLNGEDLPFNGAADMTHPAIGTAVTNFQARAIEELFPATGPVKSIVVGTSDTDREDQADRVTNYLNYQLTEQDQRYFWDTDQMLYYLPIDGSAFKRIGYCPQSKMTKARLVKARDLIVPYDANSLEDADRYTFRYTVTKHELARKVASGEYVEDHQLDEDSLAPTTDQKEFEDVADNRQESYHEDDSSWLMYEMHAELDAEEAKSFDPLAKDCEHSVPYVITFDSDSNDIVSIRRNWNEDDDSYKKVIHFVHYKFLPGLGFYGFGYLHVIGGLGMAASGAVRALLDGAATASLQGGFKSKEAKMAGEFVFSPGVWKDVEMSAEDLAKSFYTPPFKEPSPALYKTLELMIAGVEKFTSTTEAMVGDTDAKNTPVGSILAVIEQGSKVFSAIHKRLHQAARLEFKLIARSNYLYMPEEYPYRVQGEERVIAREDFDSRVDVIPVSDPNIFSNTQRIAMCQAVLQLMESKPDLYSDQAWRAAHKSLLKALKVPDIEEYLKDRKVKRVDPVTENQLVISGTGIQAFPEQDHDAHIQVHMMWLQEIQGLPMEPGMLQAVMMALQAHMAEHYGYAYRQRIEAQLGTPLPAFDFANYDANEDMPAELDMMVARAVAQHVQPPQLPPSEEEIAAQESAGEEERKNAAAAADIERKNAATSAEIQRKDAAAEAERRRKMEDSDMLPSEIDEASRRG